MSPSSPGCILLEFYIKPQLGQGSDRWIKGCILLEFYIKPQLEADVAAIPVVVYY